MCVCVYQPVHVLIKSQLFTLTLITCFTWKPVCFIPRSFPLVFRMIWVPVYHGSAAAAESLQSCPTLCDPIDGSPPGSPVPGILQARTLEWVAISLSSARKWKVKVKLLSRVRLVATPWTAAHQAPPSMGFSRQEYWSGVPLPSPYHGSNPSQIKSLYFNLISRAAWELKLSHRGIFLFDIYNKSNMCYELWRREAQSKVTVHRALI